MCPNLETGQLMETVFGIKSDPVQKTDTMIFFFQKFRNVNTSPRYLERELPKTLVERAVEALTRIGSADGGEVTIERADRDAQVLDQTQRRGPYSLWMQTESQRTGLRYSVGDAAQPIVVHGPHVLWYHRELLPYYSVDSCGTAQTKQNIEKQLIDVFTMFAQVKPLE